MEMKMDEIGTGTFNDPLRHAAGMRQAMDEPKMRLWSSLPSFFQNTIFHGEQDTAVKFVRMDPLEERLRFASELKDRGSALLKSAPGNPDSSADLEEAIRCYEKAAGVLRYVECTRRDWRNEDGSYKGIEDEFLRLDSTALEGDLDGAQRARALVAACYLNMSLVATRLGRFDEAEQACNALLSEVLRAELESPQAVKALYRRAQARIARFEANGIEQDRTAALADLKAAALVAPQDREVRGMLQHLREQQQAQLQKAKQGFAGLFERGEVVREEVESKKHPFVPPSEIDPSKLDLRDPRVQRMLDISIPPDQC